jgi:hypothetical protein
MARVTLYVSDDFKARMDAAGDEINWSDVARPALIAAAAAFEHTKGRNMTTAIERLRASKREADQHDKLFGNKEGRAWAEDKADYRSLQHLHWRRRTYPAEAPWDALQHAVDPDDVLDLEPLCEVCPALSNSRSDKYMEAFVEAAVKFYLEVREEVERD